MDGKVVDMTAFLGQFVGRAMGEELVAGASVDGISGATKSVEGLVEGLNEAAGWVGRRAQTAVQ